jgi:hypothetical protein
MKPTSCFATSFSSLNNPRYHSPQAGNNSDRPWHQVFLAKNLDVFQNEFLANMVIRHTGTDRLLDEQHAGEVGPAVLILDRFGCASYPAEGLIINVIASLQSILSKKITPFSCSNPSSDEHPGPPGYESGAQFVLVN